ncbi:MAG: glycine reductase [Synergistales bacterium]|nr:glycine reductase [Synergistales bacterium]
MSAKKELIAEALGEIVEAARHGGPRVRIGLLSSGSEHGPEEMARGGRRAMQDNPGLEVVMIGPRVESFDDLAWVETPDCEADIAQGMERALEDGTVQGAVALHYPFPMGVATIGRVVTPAKGKPMILASTTGSSAVHRVEAMIRNALYGVAVARASGIPEPTVGILNVEGAQTVYRSLQKLVEAGYPMTFGSSVRRDGGAVLRGNDILAGAVDVCVTDTLTGNVLIKMFSAYSTGGSYEALGWGYGPSAGEGWDKVISIISRASGAPVIAGAVAFTAQAVRGNLPGLVKGELAAARKAGLDEELARAQPRQAAAGEEVTAPPREPTDEELHGVDVLAIEDAVRALWKASIYAESAMGCTGPVVKVNSRNVDKAAEALKEAGYL